MSVVVASIENTMLSDDKCNKLREELKDFLKCINGNVPMFLALCEYAAIDGHRLDPECCAPVDKELIYNILRDAIIIITGNRPVNGKSGNWNCGCFGSRWLDIDPRPYGLDYIRCAFYSKKTSNKEWKHEKPYAIQITIEKGR